MKSVAVLISKVVLGFILLTACCGSTLANVVPTAICKDMTANQCALKVKAVLTDPSKSPEDAVRAWGAWSEVYEQAYRSMPNAPKTPEDLDRFEGAVADKIESLTQPENIALDLAIAKYFPRLAAILSLPEKPIIAAVMIFLAPSPIVTPLQELQATNDELSKLMMLKISPLLKNDWQTKFGSAVEQAIDGNVLGPKP